MILGILSDTHGHAARAARALTLLERVGAEAFVHCGDVGGLGVLDELAGRRAWVVCGNTDWPGEALAAYGRSLGIEVAEGGPMFIRVGGRRLAVCHGHEAAFAQAIDAGYVRESGDGDNLLLPATAKILEGDYLLHGHTHVAADTRLGRLRVINPGALHRASVHTVATLDLARDAVDFWQVLDEVMGDRAPASYMLP